MEKTTSPTIYAIAGSPAAGKTTFRHDGLRKGLFPTNAFVHDCDEVMVKIKEYQAYLKLHGAEAAFNKWELAARERAESSLHKAVKEKNDIIYDRSCALPSSYDFLKSLVENEGYQLVMHFLNVDLSIAISRAEKRERENSRHIPHALLKERHQGIRSLWPKYLSIANQVFLYDNNCPIAHLIATFHSNQLYSSRDQDCDFDRAKAPGFADRKSVHISNIDRLAIDKPRELSHGSKSNPDPGWSIHIQDHNAYQQFLVHESLINV